MPLIMYLTKAPKYRNFQTGKYETIQGKDIELIDKYYDWVNMKAEDGNTGSSFTEWCGVPMADLPNKDVVGYYRKFFTLKCYYEEYIGKTTGHTIFDQLVRLGRVTHFIRWFVDNVGQNFDAQGYLVVSKEHLLDLLMDCRKVRNGCVVEYCDDEDGNLYSVNMEIAQKHIPLMDSSHAYTSAYANSVIEMIPKLEKILKETNFETETIYFNYGDFC